MVDVVVASIVLELFQVRQPTCGTAFGGFPCGIKMHLLGWGIDTPTTKTLVVW